jgi:hypothetical protein
VLVDLLGVLVFFVGGDVVSLSIVNYSSISDSRKAL